MPEFFDHERLEVYQSAVRFMGWGSRLLASIALSIAAKDHLDRAAESIIRNVVRANARRSPADRANLFSVAYGSALECAACLDILHAWEVVEQTDVEQGKADLDRIVAMLIGIRASAETEFREPSAEYGATQHASSPLFSHESLRAYRSGLRFVRWVAALV